MESNYKPNDALPFDPPKASGGGNKVSFVILGSKLIYNKLFINDFHIVSHIKEIFFIRFSII
jgi:hypothetical protein